MSNAARSPAAPTPMSPRQAGRLIPAGLVLAVVAAYVSSFGGVFVFDDRAAILENPTFAAGWRLDQLLLYPGEQAGTLGGRPVANLTLALNHALSGVHPWSYHAFNLAVHVAATLVLYGWLSLTFRRPGLAPRFGRDADWLAGAVALAWGLHPLQTESVTYVVQRVESLGGLWLLLVLYAFARAVDCPAQRRWPALAVACAWLGVATKETAYAAPLLVLLYDRALVATGGWCEVWSRRGRLHAALLSSWVLLAVLVASTGGRGGSAGFSVDVNPWTYLLTQAYAIAHYIRLAFWPSPLVFDYGTWLAPGFGAVALPFFVLAAAVLATVRTVIRRPVLALPGAWFFLILAPSSSVVPVATQTMAEHRMYLPLAALVVGVVLLLYRLGGRRGLLVMLPLAAVAGAATHLRNLDYHDELTLWTQTATDWPANFRAHATVGSLRAERGDDTGAVAAFEQAVALAPDRAPIRLNLSASLLRLGRTPEAIVQAERAVQLEPSNANARVNLGNALAAADRLAEAVGHYEAALRVEPEAEDVHLNLASALGRQGDVRGAVRHLTLAARLNPNRIRTWLDLAQAEVSAGNRAGAERAANEARRRAPEDVEVLFLLGNLAASAEDLVTALGHFRRAVVLNPAFIPARNNLANALLMLGQVDEAIVHYREILARQPGDRRVQENLAYALELQRERSRRER